MQNAEINDTITKLYKKVETYAAEDCWYFDLPLVLMLCKPLRSQCQWHEEYSWTSKSLVQRAMIGQTMLNQYYYPQLTSARTVPNWIDPDGLNLSDSIYKLAYRTHCIISRSQVQSSHEVTWHSWMKLNCSFVVWCSKEWRVRVWRHDVTPSVWHLTALLLQLQQQWLGMASPWRLLYASLLAREPFTCWWRW
jgi:hypothetical protein